MTLAPDDPRHGTENGYTNYECRCQRCRAANAEAHRAYMDRKPEQREKHRERERERYYSGKATSSAGKGYVSPSRRKPE